MEPILNSAQIILVAEEHDLDLIEWLSRMSALEGNFSKIFQYEGHSLVDTSKFSINKLEQDFTITLKKFEGEDLVAAQSMAREYIKDFPDFSYTAVAFDFMWTIELGDNDKLKNTFLVDQERFDRIFDNSSYNIGGLLEYIDDTFLVRIIIPPQATSPFYVMFAYRSESKDVGELTKRISFFTKAIDNTRNVVADMLGG